MKRFGSVRLDIDCRDEWDPKVVLVVIRFKDEEPTNAYDCLRTDASNLHRNDRH